MILAIDSRSYELCLSINPKMKRFPWKTSFLVSDESKSLFRQLLLYIDCIHIYFCEILMNSWFGLHSLSGWCAPLKHCARKFTRYHLSLLPCSPHIIQRCTFIPVLNLVQFMSSLTSKPCPDETFQGGESVMLTQQRSDHLQWLLLLSLQQLGCLTGWSKDLASLYRASPTKHYKLWHK